MFINRNTLNVYHTSIAYCYTIYTYLCICIYDVGRLCATLVVRALVRESDSLRVHCKVHTRSCYCRLDGAKDSLQTPCIRLKVVDSKRAVILQDHQSGSPGWMYSLSVATTVFSYATNLGYTRTDVTYTLSMVPAN